MGMKINRGPFGAHDLGRKSCRLSFDIHDLSIHLGGTQGTHYFTHFPSQGTCSKFPVDWSGWS